MENEAMGDNLWLNLKNIVLWATKGNASAGGKKTAAAQHQLPSSPFWQPAFVISHELLLRVACHYSLRTWQAPVVMVA